MLDIDLEKLLLVVIVAIVVIGPKDLPMALRTAGRWIGKVRRVSNHFRSGLETMIREAEMEELERKWREQNAAIMTANPAGTDAGVLAHGDVAHPVAHIDPVVAAHAPPESAPTLPAPAVSGAIRSEPGHTAPTEGSGPAA